MERGNNNRMIPNLEYEKCAKCGDRKGEIPISDEDGNTFWICEYCDSELFESTYKIEGLTDEN